MNAPLSHLFLIVTSYCMANSLKYTWPIYKFNYVAWLDKKKSIPSDEVSYFVLAKGPIFKIKLFYPIFL